MKRLTATRKNVRLNSILLPIFIIIESFLYILSSYIRSTIGFYEYGPMIGRFTYQFFHENLFHIAINMVSLYFITEYMRKISLWKINNIVLIGYICSVLATFGSEMGKSTIGASGMVFAILGMSICYIRNNINISTTCIILISINIIYIISGSQSVNALCHILSFTYGMMAALSYETFKTKNI